MQRRWQFGLRSLLGVMAVLAVPFWLLTNPDADVRFWAALLIVPIAGGCAGYLAAGSSGLWPGVCLAVLVGLAVAAFVIPFL
jgi:hypothetical protein